MTSLSFSLLLSEPSHHGAWAEEGGGPEKPRMAGRVVAFGKLWGFVEESSGPQHWKLSTRMRDELLLVLLGGASSSMQEQ